jgi:hypothetical protein
MLNRLFFVFKMTLERQLTAGNRPLTAGKTADSWKDS